MTGSLAALGLGLGAALRGRGQRGLGGGRGIASLSPAFTETIFSFGRGDRLIARSDYCRTPDAALGLPAVGTSLTPSLERLAELSPALLLLDASSATRVAELAALAPVEVLPWLTLEEVIASIGRIGDLVDAAPAAAQLQARLRGALDQPEPAGAPRGLMLLAGPDLGRGPSWFLSPESLHGRAQHGAGLRHAVPVPSPRPPVLSVEGLLALDPDAIVVVGAGATPTALDHLPTLRAVQQRRVGALDGLHHLGTGPGILEFAARLRAVVSGLP